MDIKNDIDKLAEKYFNEEVKSIPEKLENNLAKLNHEEKVHRIFGITAALYSQAALNANSKVLSEILTKYELHEK